MDNKEKARLETRVQEARQEYIESLCKVLYHLADYLADTRQDVSSLIKSVSDKVIEDFIEVDKYQESDYFNDFETIGYFEASFRLAQKKYNEFIKQFMEEA